MAVIGFAYIFLRNLFAVVMLSGMFSLTAAVLYVVMDAVDVAFTEAAVGAGIATVLGLATLGLIGVVNEKPSKRGFIGPFLVVLITGAVLINATLDMPDYGDPDAPIPITSRPAISRSQGARSGSPTSSPRFWRATAATTLWAR